MFSGYSVVHLKLITEGSLFFVSASAILIISHYFVHVSIRLVSPQSHISLNFCDYNDNTLSWSCQCQVGDTLVPTFQNIYAYSRAGGGRISMPFQDVDRRRVSCEFSQN